MAVSINTGGTYSVSRLSNADSLTGWSAIKIEGSGGSPSAFASVGSIDLVAEGNNAVASIANKQRVELRYTGSSQNLTNQIVYLWGAFLAAGSAFTKANGGMQIALTTGSNTNYYNVAGSDTYSGGFVKWAIDTTKAPFENSGAAATISSIDAVGFVCDVGGTTTRFDNMVVDAIDVGTGLTFQGTTTGDALFTESAIVDDNTAIGILKLENGIIFSQGSIEFSGTAQTSDAETLVFTDTVGGSYIYNMDITGTVVFNNSNVSSVGAVSYDFDSSGATSFTMSGGSLAAFNTLTTASGNSISGVVFQSGGTSTIANALTGSTFNLCGAITLTGTMTSCTLNKLTAPVVASSLDDFDACTFVSDGTGYGINLGTISSNTSMTWNSSASGYTDASSGDELIVVTVNNGVTLTINNEGSGLSVHNLGTGTVNIVSGAVTVKVTAQTADGTKLENARVYLARVSDDSVIFNALTDANGVVQNTAYTYTADEAVYGWARKSSSAPYYKQGPISGTITSSGFSSTAILSLDQ